MTDIIRIKNIEIGGGIPKICVPVVDKSIDDILSSIDDIIKQKVEIVEWRADWYESHNVDDILKVLFKIRKKLKNRVVLFTFRTAFEGGNGNLTKEEYFCLCKNVVESGLVDLIDIEMSFGRKYFKEIVEYSHKKGIYVVGSMHNFEKTPKDAEIFEVFDEMNLNEADILKIAVMPKTEKDIERILELTRLSSQKYIQPVIAIAMGEMGVKTRIYGEIYGSAITFASIGKVSAPGQIDVVKMRKYLEEVHRTKLEIKI